VMFAGQIGVEFDCLSRADAVLIDLPIPQDKLAEFIGTSRESVNRHFNDLKAEGLTAMHERKIVLTPLFVAKFMRNKLPPKQIVLPASFTSPPLNVQAVKAPLERV
jgi:hypothetical protein